MPITSPDFQIESLGYQSKVELFGNSFQFRKVETFDYEIYYHDFQGFNSLTIQDQIKEKFKSEYKGDINVKSFSLQNTQSFPSDSIRASKFNVTVEVVNNIAYENLDKEILKNLKDYFKNLLSFKEEITFSKNQNGNREFNQTVSFGIRDNENNLGQNGRKNLAQTIAKEVFESNNNNDYNLQNIIPLNLLNLQEIGQTSEPIDESLYKNYYTETYDLIKNSYSFSRKREILPSNETSKTFTFNNSYSLTMNDNGVIDVTEKVNSFARKMSDFETAKTDLETHYLGAYNRCLEVYNNFHNTQVLLNERSDYDLSIILKNIPTKLLKNYNKQSLTLGYDVTYTSSPETQIDASDSRLEYILSQTIEFNVDPYNKVEATHSFDYTFNKTKEGDYSFYAQMMKNPIHQSSSQSLLQTYYQDNFSSVTTIYPNLKLIKTSASLPNIKTKASVKYNYSNSPIYFVNVQGIEFKIYEVIVDVKKPVDIINEFKIINRETRGNKSVLSYAYQSEKGEISIKMNTTVGKNSKEFFGNGNFTYIGDKPVTEPLFLKDCLVALYKEAGQKFLSNFNNPSFCLNWFISDSSFSFDSTNGTINATINYIYTSKMRTG